MPRRLVSFLADLQIERIVGAAMLLAIFMVMLAGVVLRYGFSFSLTWYEEFCRYGLILITALGIGAGLKNGTHILIDNSYLPPVLRRAATLIAMAVTLGFLACLAWYAMSLAGPLRASRSPALQMPTSWFYTAFGLLALLGVARIVERALRAKKGS